MDAQDADANRCPTTDEVTIVVDGVGGSSAGRQDECTNRTSVLARPTGLKRAGTHSGFRHILIDGREDWNRKAGESA
jgi:hypothetical protein